jgi:hypothetical protein
MRAMLATSEMQTEADAVRVLIVDDQAWTGHVNAGVGGRAVD